MDIGIILPETNIQDCGQFPHLNDAWSTFSGKFNIISWVSDSGNYEFGISIYISGNNTRNDIIFTYYNNAYDGITFRSNGTNIWSIRKQS